MGEQAAPGRRRSRWVLSLVAIGAASLPLVAGCIASNSAGASRPASHPPHPNARGRVTPPPLDGPAGAAAALARRAAAILHHDRAAFLATVDPSSASFRVAQARLYDNLSGLRFASWSYEIAPGPPPARPAALSRYRSPVYAPAAVYLHYELAGYDAEPTSEPQYLTFVRRGTGWFVASDSDFSPVGMHTTRDLWDDGPVVEMSSSHTLVLGHPDSLPLMRQLSAEADNDVPRVDAVWRLPWSQRVVIVVPASETELHTLLGGGASLDQIAAVATAELVATTAHPSPVGDRILINPPAFGTLGTLGRQVVITHEITHVATRSVTAPAAPTWLVEGFADYVGYRDTHVDVVLAASELRQEVQAGHIPQALPANSDFRSDNPRLALAYEEAWLACRLIAARVGEASLAQFYDSAAATGSSQELNNAFESTLHMSTEQFIVAWQNYVQAELQ